MNAELGVLDGDVADAIAAAAREVARGRHDDQFPIDVFQTGSGTSTNMNVNEVVATPGAPADRADAVHPNDHVNAGQSSNDTFPTAIRLAAATAVAQRARAGPGPPGDGAGAQGGRVRRPSSRPGAPT